MMRQIIKISTLGIKIFTKSVTNILSEKICIIFPKDLKGGGARILTASFLDTFKSLIS